MPTLFTIFGLRFYFYSEEHFPIHVHVRNSDGRAKIQVDDLTLTNLYKEQIKEFWYEYFMETR